MEKLDESHNINEEEKHNRYVMKETESLLTFNEEVYSQEFMSRENKKLKSLINQKISTQFFSAYRKSDHELNLPQKSFEEQLDLESLCLISLQKI